MDELTGSVTFSRKVNLGNYETADFSVTISGIRPDMDDGALAPIMEKVHLGWDVAAEALQDQIDTFLEQRSDLQSIHSAAPSKPSQPAAASASDPLQCRDCGEQLQETRFKDGTIWAPAQLAAYGRRKHGRVLCMTHYREANDMVRRAQQLDAVPF